MRFPAQTVEAKHAEIEILPQTLGIVSAEVDFCCVFFDFFAAPRIEGFVSVRMILQFRFLVGRQGEYHICRGFLDFFSMLRYVDAASILKLRTMDKDWSISIEC